MIKDLEAFLIVDSTFLLGGGRITDAFVVGGGATSIKGRGVRVFVFVFEVKFNS